MAVPPSSPLVVALDYDGTLVPINRERAGRPLPEAARRALRRLEGMPGVRTAVVSGRGLPDLRRLVRSPGTALIGNHGLEARDGRWTWALPAAKAARPRLAAAAREIRRIAAGVPGFFLEDKRLSLSAIFPGLAPVPGTRLRAEAERAVRAAGVGLLGGKNVWNLRPRVRWDKGRGIRRWMRERAVRGAVVFLGDDLTDEEGFRSLGPKALTVRVGPGRTSARFRLSQSEVAAFLRRAADIRACAVPRRRVQS